MKVFRTIMKIAVVNADSGVMVEGEKVYYAAELMSFLDTNFENTYTTGMEAAENEFAIIKEGGTAVGDQRSLIADTFAMVDILTDAENNLVYETGMTDLVNLAREFEEDVSAKKFTAKERLDFQERD